MKDHWSLKEYQPPDSAELWFYRKNLSPRVRVRHPAYAHLAYLTFAYTPRDESGLPTNADDEVLFRIEEEGLGDLTADDLAIQVGAVTKSGIKDLVFYTRDPHEFLRRAERFRVGCAQFRVGCEVSPDPKWSQYDDFP